MPSESRTVSMSFSELIDVAWPARPVKSGRVRRSFWWRRLGCSRILQFVFANERAGKIHAVRRVENRNLDSVNDQRDSSILSIGVQRLDDVVLQGCEQFLIALLILCFGVFAFALVIPFLRVQRVDLGLDLGWSCPARLL